MHLFHCIGEILYKASYIYMNILYIYIYIYIYIILYIHFLVNLDSSPFYLAMAQSQCLKVIGRVWFEQSVSWLQVHLSAEHVSWSPGYLQVVKFWKEESTKKETVQGERMGTKILKKIKMLEN